MDILLTLRQPLVPPDTGGKVRSLNILSRLARRARIHAVSFAEPERDATAVAGMEQIFESYTPIPWRETKKYSARFYGEVLANHFGSWPYFLAKCNQPELKATVESLLAKRSFDVLFCDFLHTAAPLSGIAFTPKVLFEHNVEFLLRKRKWEMEKNPMRKSVFAAEWKKTRRIEAAMCTRFDHVFTVSQEDEQTFQTEFALRNVSTLQTGVDTEYFRPQGGPEEQGRLVFVGSMDWDPNEDGVIWFLNEIYPRVRALAPNSSFSIVGRNPSERLKAATEQVPGVELTGRVDDVRPHLAKAQVVIVPLRVGGGTRIKIPEAMAMRKAIVSTTIGAEGLALKPGREILIADESEQFAASVATLLREAAVRNGIAAAARNAVVQRYGWDVAVDSLESVLLELVDRATAFNGSRVKIVDSSVYA